MSYQRIKTMSKISFIVCQTLLLGFNLFGLYNKNDYSTITQAKTAYLEGKAECIMEATSRRILYASNDDLRLPMASTTKILTAITVLESCKDIEEPYIIPIEAEGIEGSSVYLKSGDKYTVKDLLFGLMLRSGNDCATALAMYCSGNIKNFSIKMNDTAQKAGALESNFENPHGLPSPHHYTTAKDLSYITCYAMQNPVFKEIVSTKYYQPRNWKNKNKLLSLYEGGIGVKTGYTKEAGRCLVSAAQKDDMCLICTLLNCPTTYERSIKLLDDAFENYKYTKLISTEDILTIQIDNKTVQAKVNEDFYYPLLAEEVELIEIKTFPISYPSKTIKNKEIIGQFEIYLAKRLLFSGNLYKL